LKTKIIALTVLLLISITTFAQIPDWTWAKSAVGCYEDEATAISTDASGNVYMTGYFESPIITFGNYTLTNTENYGSSDIFIVKYDSSGNVQWARSAGGINDDSGRSDIAYDIAADAYGNAYVVGCFRTDSITFGSYLLTNYAADSLFNYEDFFIVKYSSEGDVLWAKSAGGNNFDIGYGVTIDAEGNVYATGSFDNSITFDSYVLTNIENTNNENFNGDIFIVKYDSLGNVIWAKNSGGNGADIAYSIAVDNSGNLYIAGYFQSNSIVFGTDTLTNHSSNYDALLAKYSSEGNVLWAISTGGSEMDGMNSIATDPNDNVYISGNFNSDSIVLGDDTLVNIDSYSFFIAKFDSAGNEIWTTNSLSNSIIKNITTDIYGNLYVTGEYSDTVIIGTDTVSCVGYDDIFLSEYNSNGNILWIKNAGGKGIDASCAISIGPNNNVFIAGFFNSDSLFIDNSLLLNSGNGDIFLAKLNSSSTGIKELTNNNYFNIFPNPANDFITIETLQLSKIEIFNIQGQILKTINSNSKEITIDLTYLPSGVYFVKARTNKEVVVKKFIKQ
jgi:hypothetical protein